MAGRPLGRAQQGVLLGLLVLVGFHQKGERGKEGEGEGEGKGGRAPSPSPIRTPHGGACQDEESSA